MDLYGPKMSEISNSESPQIKNPLRLLSQRESKSREWVLNHIFKSIYWNLKETKYLTIQQIIKVEHFL